MIGLDFPVRPDWIHDVLRLWQPGESLSTFKEKCINQTMQELGGEKTRRNTFAIIARLFLNTEGNGNSRKLAQRDIWVSLSREFPVTTMSPAYLVQLVSSSDIAQDATEFINRRYKPGDVLSSSDFRQFFIRKYGERKVVLNSGSAFLKTLQYFGILETGSKAHEYVYVRKLKPTKDIFPLFVWSIRKTDLSPQVDIDQFSDRTEFSFIETNEFDSFWKNFQPSYWVISEGINRRTATLRNDFEEVIEKL